MFLQSKHWFDNLNARITSIQALSVENISSEMSNMWYGLQALQLNSSCKVCYLACKLRGISFLKEVFINETAKNIVRYV